MDKNNKLFNVDILHYLQNYNVDTLGRNVKAFSEFEYNRVRKSLATILIVVKT